MGKCEYCGREPANHEVIDDDEPFGMIMICDGCHERFYYTGPIIEAGDSLVGYAPPETIIFNDAETAAKLLFGEIAALVTDADTGYRGIVEDRHLEVAQKILNLFTQVTAVIDTEREIM